MARRNPPWTRDELILALDLYFRHNPLHISKEHPEIIALSDLLNRLPIHSERPDQAHFRNPNGVYMKLCNFLRFDPTYDDSGLRRGGKLEEQVWEEFAEDPGHLQVLALAITENMVGEGPESLPDFDEDAEAPEGRVLLRAHQVRERSRSLVRKKKQSVLAKNGRLACEVCGFDFQQTYGVLGEGFIECHYKVPLADLRPGQKTRLRDLSLVCANCHRMLHRGGEQIDVTELQELIEA